MDEFSNSAARYWEVRESLIANGPAAGTRQIEVRVEGGIDLRILPDRGFDIGQAWWRGRPLAWTDPGRDRPPDPGVTGTDWLGSFGGGLLTTCGLRHVGQPQDGHGLHGRFSHQRALTMGSRVHRDVGDTVVSVRGIIGEPAGFDALFEVEREISTRTGRPEVAVSDVVTNRGGATEDLKVLYHLNFPRSAEDAGLHLNGRPLGPDILRQAWNTAELSIPDGEEILFEIRGSACPVSVSWRRGHLSRLHLWAARAQSGPVLAVEPSTTSLLTPDGGGIPLEPGESVELGFVVRGDEVQKQVEYR